MRANDPPIACLVGTPKGRLTKYEAMAHGNGLKRDDLLLKLGAGAD